MNGGIVCIIRMILTLFYVAREGEQNIQTIDSQLTVAHQRLREHTACELTSGWALPIVGWRKSSCKTFLAMIACQNSEHPR